MISPTGMGIRNDNAGLGNFGAPRGSRLHNGIDWECVPGQDVKLPCKTGKLVRTIWPYGDDLSWKGVVIEGKLTAGAKVFIVMFYVDHSMSPKTRYKKGDVIGKAQDITKRYPNQGMKPHVHMSMYMSIDYEDGVTFSK